jgi:hypothetical protein
MMTVLLLVGYSLLRSSYPKNHGTERGDDPSTETMMTLQSPLNHSMKSWESDSTNITSVPTSDFMY